MRILAVSFLLIISGVAYGRSDRARPFAAHADIANLKVTLDKFASDCGRYPTTTEGLSALIRCPTNIPTAHWYGPYLDPAQIPIDPWGNEYVYRFPGLHNTNGFDLYSCGTDGISKSGGNDADDINSWDPNSPRGNFSDRLVTLAGTAIPSLFVFALLLMVGLSVAAMFSRRVRDLIGGHISLWVILLLVGLLLLLLSLAIPRIS